MVGIGNTRSLLSSVNNSNASNNTAAAAARLASGRRLTRASDDIAALAAGTSLNSQISALRASQGNLLQASSLLQVANGGLNQQLDILQRQRALSTQASSGQLNDAARAALNQEFQGLNTELARLANSTNFNGIGLLNGSTGGATSLVSSNAQAATFQPGAATGSNGGTAANSSVAIQAFNRVTGAAASGLANAGNLDVTDSNGTLLSNSAFNNVDPTLAGGISNFALTNVNFGTSATITATIGGIEYRGTYTNGATSAVLSNGNTNVRIATGTTAGAATALNISDAAAVASSTAGLNNVFSNTQIQRTQVVGGVDFTGTALSGVTGTAASGGIVTARLNSNVANISNFRYAGNTGAPDSSVLTVEVNGQTFTATGVRDNLSSANGTIVFQSADNQVLRLDLNGLAAPLGNIRTDSTQQANLVNALNTGFARAGGSLSFPTEAGGNPITAALGNTNPTALFNGQTPNLSTQAGAANAALAIDAAIRNLSSAQANVGSLQSRINSASNAIGSALINQQSAASALLDTDIAAESTNFAQGLLQQQASISVRAQTNRLSQGLLRLVQ